MQPIQDKHALALTGTEQDSKVSLSISAPSPVIPPPLVRSVSVFEGSQQRRHGGNRMRSLDSEVGADMLSFLSKLSHLPEEKRKELLAKELQRPVPAGLHRRVHADTQRSEQQDSMDDEMKERRKASQRTFTLARLLDIPTPGDTSSSSEQAERGDSREKHVHAKVGKSKLEETQDVVNQMMMQALQESKGMYMCTYAHIDALMYSCVYACVYRCLYAHACVSLFVPTVLLTCVHTHTHIYTTHRTLQITLAQISRLLLLPPPSRLTYTSILSHHHTLEPLLSIHPTVYFCQLYLPGNGFT